MKSIMPKLLVAFAALFRQIGWMPHGGLALANSLATALETVLLMILMRKRLSGIDGKNIARGFGQASFAALGMGIALIWWMQTQITSATWMIVLGGLVIGGIVYLLGVWVLKVPEMRAGISFLRRKLGK